MTKIKNFRIILRPREVARLVKATERLQITPALEASIEHLINDFKARVQPAALYTTLPRAIAEKTTTLPLPEKGVAISLIGVSIGSAIDVQRVEAAGRKDAIQAALLAALQQEALQQSVQFVLRLILEQAKEEECELSPVLPVQEAPLLSALGALLGVQRIGIDFHPEAPALPPYARLAWMSWSPAAKNTSKRPEKAAVS